MIHDCRPILRVTDMRRSLAYYRDALRFAIGWRWSDRRQTFLADDDTQTDIGTALVGYDRVQFILVQQAQGELGMWLFLDVDTADEVDQLHQEWLNGGAIILDPPSLRPWGTYEMRVQDPDGHVFRVASPPRSRLDVADSQERGRRVR